MQNDTMANENTENDEKTNGGERVALQVRLTPDLYTAIKDLAVADDRSMANATERLLKTHPLIETILGGEPATAGAGN